MCLWDDGGMRKTGSVSFMATVNSACVTMDVETRYAEGDDGSVTGWHGWLSLKGDEPENVLSAMLRATFGVDQIVMDFSDTSAGLVLWGWAL